MAEEVNTTKALQEIINDRKNSPGGGDPLFGATQNDTEIFNGGMEFTRDFSTEPQSNPLSIYLPNPLNKFDIYTYNIAIHQVHPKDVNDLEVAIAEGKTVLICDNSQESRFNITSTEQTFVLGHNQVRETFSNKFTIQVAEPNGATFLNALASSAFVNLGIEAPMQARYIMKIEFLGRDSSGRAVKLPQTFYYRLFF